MSCLILNVDLPTGVTIKEACEDAVILATRIGVTIKFEFNDKIVFSLPYTCIESLVKAYHEAVKNDSDFVCTFEKNQNIK